VLAGAEDTLTRLRPILFIATHDGVALSNLTIRAKDVGYRCWCVQTARFNLGKFNRREDDPAAAMSLVHSHGYSARVELS